MTSGCRPVHVELDVRLAQHAKDTKVFHPFNLTHGTDDPLGYALKKFEIITVDLHGKLTFYSANCFLHVVGDGLRKVPDHAGNFVEFALHGADHSFFILVEHRPPLFLGLQADVVLGIGKTSGIRSVIRTPHLTRAFGRLWKRAKQAASLVREPDAFTRSGAGSERASDTERAIVRMRQELGANDSAQGQIDSGEQTQTRQPHRSRPMVDRPSHPVAIASFQEFHYRVAPFLHALAE